MPPKKSVENGSAPADSSKPDEGCLQFAFECLRAVGEDGILDMTVLSKAMGHTNVASTRNAFGRYKKRWGFGNINTKMSAVPSTVTEEGSETAALKPNIDGNKVGKKRGRPSTKGSPKKKLAATNPSSDEDQVAADIKADGTDTD